MHEEHMDGDLPGGPSDDLDMFKQQDIYKAAHRKGVAQGVHEDKHEASLDHDHTPEQSPEKPAQDLSNLHPNKRILYELQRMPDNVKKETSLL